MGLQPGFTNSVDDDGLETIELDEIGEFGFTKPPEDQMRLTRADNFFQEVHVEEFKQSPIEVVSKEDPTNEQDQNSERTAQLFKEAAEHAK